MRETVRGIPEDDEGLKSIIDSRPNEVTPVSEFHTFYCLRTTAGADTLDAPTTLQALRNSKLTDNLSKLSCGKIDTHMGLTITRLRLEITTFSLGLFIQMPHNILLEVLVSLEVEDMLRLRLVCGQHHTGNITTGRLAFRTSRIQKITSPVFYN